MPVMGGIESCKEIRSTIPQENQPRYIIALTADVYAETRDDCIKFGMVEVLTKPVNRERLKLVLDKYCQENPIQSE